MRFTPLLWDWSTFGNLWQWAGSFQAVPDHADLSLHPRLQAQAQAGHRQAGWCLDHHTPQGIQWNVLHFFNMVAYELVIII